VGNSVTTAHGEVLITSMRRNVRKRRIVITLDDIRDKRNDIRELSHIDIEVTQLISTGFCHDNLTAISDGGQTAKVARGIELRVGGPRHGDAGNGTRRERSQRGTRAAHGARSASRSAVHDASACVDGSNVAR